MRGGERKDDSAGQKRMNRQDAKRAKGGMIVRDEEIAWLANIANSAAIEVYRTGIGYLEGIVSYSKLLNLIPGLSINFRHPWRLGGYVF